MKQISKNEKGITLIALVITIVLILVIAVIAINVAVGNNGLIPRANEAKVLYKNAQYYEEIDMAIIEEEMDRLVQINENEAFIESVYYRLWGKEQASNLSTGTEYTRRPWIASQPQMLDESYTPNANKSKNIYLLIETVDGYEIWVKFDNVNNTAEILKDRTGKISTEKYTVSFNPGEGTGTIESVEVRANFGIKLPTGEGFTKQGYVLTGWKDEENNEYDKETTYIVTKDVTLTAQWNENIAYITYLPGFTLPTGQNEKDPVGVEKGTETTVLESQYTRVGYNFNGWLCSEDNKVYNIDDNENSKILADTDKTLTAQWTAIVYNISYELNGGNLETEVTNPVTYTIETPTFTLNNPVKEDETFIGWSGTGLTGSKNTEVTIAQGSTGNREYTASWKASGARVTLKNGNSVIIRPDNISEYIGTEVDYTCNGGGTWKIFYLDQTSGTYPNGKYGDCTNKDYTLYIKRDYDSNLKTKPALTNVDGTYYKKFNPLDPGTDNSYYAKMQSADLLNINNWNSNYCNTNVASYAIGTPSLELFADAYNQYKGSVIINYSFFRDWGYQLSGGHTFSGIEAGPGNVFYGSGEWHLASKGFSNTERLMYITGNTIKQDQERKTYGICPIVALK